MVLVLVAGSHQVLGHTCQAGEGVECGEEGDLKYKDVNTVLGSIEELQKTNLNRAYEDIQKFVRHHPDLPRGLLLLSKIQRSLYSKLHPKMREIGKLELLNPSLEVLLRLLKLPAPQLPDSDHSEIADFAVSSALSSTNRTLSVRVLQTVLERHNKEVPEETYQ